VSFFGSGQLINPDPSDLHDLTGAHVNAPDTFEWHAVGGIEYEFRRRWSVFLDFRYIFASRSLSLSFNDSDSLGVSVPNTITEEGSPLALSNFGAFRITQGGLIDGGHLEPRPGETTDCVATPALCVFVEGNDGVPDPGVYYVKGGSIKYGGASLQVGIRFTF
jgi:hypothetical protein